MDEELLSDDEIERLIISLGTSRGDKGFNEHDVDMIVEWATDTRLRNDLLNLVLRELIDIDLKAGEEVVFVARQE